MGGFAACNARLQVRRHGQGDTLPLHDPHRLRKFLRVQYIGARLLHVRMDGQPHSLLQIEGRQRARPVRSGINQNALNRGQRGLSRHRTHQRRHGVADFLSVKDNFHSLYLALRPWDSVPNPA